MNADRSGSWWQSSFPRELGSDRTLPRHRDPQPLAVSDPLDARRSAGGGRWRRWGGEGPRPLRPRPALQVRAVDGEVSSVSAPGPLSFLDPGYPRLKFSFFAEMMIGGGCFCSSCSSQGELRVHARQALARSSGLLLQCHQWAVVGFRAVRDPGDGLCVVIASFLMPILSYDLTAGPAFRRGSSSVEFVFE